MGNNMKKKLFRSKLKQVDKEGKDVDMDYSWDPIEYVFDDGGDVSEESKDDERKTDEGLNADDVQNQSRPGVDTPKGLPERTRKSPGTRTSASQDRESPRKAEEDRESAEKVSGARSVIRELDEISVGGATTLKQQSRPAAGVTQGLVERKSKRLEKETSASRDRRIPKEGTPKQGTEEDRESAESVSEASWSGIRELQGLKVDGVKALQQQSRTGTEATEGLVEGTSKSPEKRTSASRDRQIRKDTFPRQEEDRESAKSVSEAGSRNREPDGLSIDGVKVFRKQSRPTPDIIKGERTSKSPVKGTLKELEIPRKTVLRQFSADDKVVHFIDQGDCRSMPIRMVKVDMGIQDLKKCLEVAIDAVRWEKGDHEMGQYIKSRLDIFYSPVWLVMVGEEFGLSTSYVDGMFAHFCIGDKSFLMAKIL